jgi:uncharacterized damage-inducible protein DinB
MSLKNQLGKYGEYNVWANLQLHKIIKNLDEADLDAHQMSSFPSIRKTVYHIWDSQHIWMMRLYGESPKEGPSKIWKGSTEDALEHLYKSSIPLAQFTHDQSEKDLKKLLITYTNLEGKEFTNNLSDIIIHVFNHSTYHRGQLVTMLRNIGVTTIPATDYMAFCRKKD